MVTYRGKSPKIRAFFKILVYRDGRHQIGIKWHILAYAGISWHIIPCKSGKKVVKLMGVPLEYSPITILNIKSGKTNCKLHLFEVKLAFYVPISLKISP